MKHRTESTTNERSARWIAAAGVLGMLGVMMTLGGCGAPMQRAGAGEGGGRGYANWNSNQPEVWDGAGSSWALVMQSPRTAQMLAGEDVRNAPEYARNDAAFGAGRDGPLLASNEWPERERADLYYARRIQLETRGDELLYFDRESRYRGGYRNGNSSSSYNQGGTGTWGFWR